MKYGKRYVVEWSPWLLKVILTIVALIFVAGGITGYGVCRISASSKEESTIPTEVVETTEEVTEAPKPEPVYYDCPLSHELQDYIRGLCEKNEIPMSLVIAMIEVESSFRPNVVSKTNDYGLMQINEINHPRFQEEFGVTDFFDPFDNVLCGITMIAEHYHRYLTLDKALMAYNLGGAKARMFWDEGIYETNYSRKVKATMEVYDAQI